MRTRAKELVADALDAYQTDQFANTDMVDGYRQLGDEVAAQVPGAIDALCLYIGTAGCFLGVSQALRRHHPPSLGSPWSPPSRPCSRAGHPAPTASRAAASASDRTCSATTTSTR